MPIAQRFYQAEQGQKSLATEYKIGTLPPKRIMPGDKNQTIT
jgi:hypothetical protein